MTLDDLKTLVDMATQDCPYPGWELFIVHTTCTRYCYRRGRYVDRDIVPRGVTVAVMLRKPNSVTLNARFRTITGGRNPQLETIDAGPILTRYLMMVRLCT